DAVAQVIECCGLGEVADRHNGKLSKGYRQRVGLAQALLGDPAVLVLDEPTVGLDPVQAVEMRALLRTLAGRTVLLSTHNLAEASALCSRVIILSHGGVVAEDTAERLGRRLEGAGRLVARIDGPPDAVAQALAALPGVVGVERGAADGQSGVSFVVLVFAIPLLTMRLLAEERRLGTLELLLTYPLRDGAIVAAKLGACLVVVATLLAGTLAYPLLVFRVEPFALEPLAAAYLGLLLF